MEYINIALAKGRLAEDTLKLIENMDISFEEYHKNNRKLVFTNDEAKVKIVLVKASDVSVYVEAGTADIGVVGKDISLEMDPNVYEIMDLNFGKCMFAVAALSDYVPKQRKKLRVATKYPNVAQRFYQKKGESIEIIKLNGSVELAPVLGLSDVIVDIVETGRTLKENGLTVIEPICPISARLIANKVSFKTEASRIDGIVSAMKRQIAVEGEK